MDVLFNNNFLSRKQRNDRSLQSKSGKSTLKTRTLDPYLPLTRLCNSEQAIELVKMFVWVFFFFFGCTGSLVQCTGSTWQHVGLSLVAVCGLLLFCSTGSRVSRLLQSWLMGLPVAVHRLSCLTACGI